MRSSVSQYPLPQSVKPFLLANNVANMHKYIHIKSLQNITCSTHLVARGTGKNYFYDQKLATVLSELRHQRYKHIGTTCDRDSNTETNRKQHVWQAVC